MVSKASTSQDWTLRFKQHKTTVLLLVSPNQSIGSIKSELLEALKATGIHDINGCVLPAKADDIIFGIPVDNNKPNQGWVVLEIPEIDGHKDPGGKVKGVRKSSVLNASPLGAGLKDGAMVAFKFREEDVDSDDWDVMIPSYDDEYGSQAGSQEELSVAET
ncbi:hypothetical protein MMC07_003566 [Pseudocyphellaria aurata]|nr:hypothetical protein [Pseudocyphellaria aurata]